MEGNSFSKGSDRSRDAKVFSDTSLGKKGTILSQRAKFWCKKLLFLAPRKITLYGNRGDDAGIMYSDMSHGSIMFSYRKHWIFVLNGLHHGNRRLQSPLWEEAARISHNTRKIERNIVGPPRRSNALR
uniref:Uncharacterized protein n=1 Tax=Caenorhabditis japonica TaxID=281687 RepID=A0A8R1E4J6_CAEJA